MQIKTSRGQAPQSLPFSRLRDLEPYVYIDVALGVLFSWTKLSGGCRLKVTPVQSFWTVVHVTFLDTSDQKKGGQTSYLHSSTVNGFQSAVDQALLALQPGERALIFGQSVDILPGRLTMLDNEVYLQLYSSNLPTLHENLEKNQRMEALELIMVVTRSLDPD